MLRETLKHFPLIGLVMTGQLIFLTVFLGTLFWVFRRGSKPFYDRLASLPLTGKGDGHE